MGRRLTGQALLDETLAVVRDWLRSGDIFVPGSRRYADPASFLLDPEAWAPQKVEFCHLVGKPVEAADAFVAAEDELHAALADLETQLAKGNPGEVRLTGDGELIIPSLTAEDVPGEADALRAELAGMLPRVPIASVFGGLPPAIVVVGRARPHAPIGSGGRHRENGRVLCAPETPDATVADLPALLGTPEGVVIGAAQRARVPSTISARPLAAALT